MDWDTQTARALHGGVTERLLLAQSGRFGLLFEHHGEQPLTDRFRLKAVFRNIEILAALCQLRTFEEEATL
jgi:hypothetical protein